LGLIFQIYNLFIVVFLFEFMRAEPILEIIGGLIAVAIGVFSILNNNLFTLFFVIVFIIIFSTFKIVEKYQSKKSTFQAS